ncbi:Tyrosine-protein kinase transmembrane receptor Ror [Holothuria leucospilota]|uniref:Tyrosine-protein kinase transmembrane receptor Ror n=1 Tax=Holothuria leucospilota TaxID=206669 RepID=A0A9Q1CSI8_HOLLE|nr:Tyrosine-protein kinase transmembrane receptor Ror [Holothuria leucospilota]
MLRNFEKRGVSQTNFIERSGRLATEGDSKLELTKFALDIAEGMSFLLNQKLCHPALNAKKVLIDQSGTCKLYDFISTEIARDKLIDILQRKSPPLAWLPPEAVFLRQYFLQSDVWSFAVVLWEIYSLGDIPYKGLTTEEIENEIRNERCLSQPVNCPGGV